MAQELIIATADLALRIQGYQAKATNLLEQAKRAEINDVDSYGKAQTFMGMAGTIKSNLEEERKGTIDAYDKRVRFINAQYKPVRDILEQAYELIRTKASAFQRSEQRRLQAEQDRRAREAEDEALRVAEEREAAGDRSGADAIVEMATSVQQPPAKVIIPRDEFTGAKLKVRRVWEGRCENVKDLCAAIAAGHIPEDVVEFKKSKLNAIAKQWAAEVKDGSLEIHRYGICAEEIDDVTR